MFWGRDSTIVCPKKSVIPEGVKRRQTANKGRAVGGCAKGPVQTRGPRRGLCPAAHGCRPSEAAEAQGHARHSPSRGLRAFSRNCSSRHDVLAALALSKASPYRARLRDQQEAG